MTAVPSLAFFFSSRAKSPDGAGGAHLAAEAAGLVAPGEPGHDARRPEAVKPAFPEAGLQGVGEAHLHALAAADAFC